MVIKFDKTIIILLFLVTFSTIFVSFSNKKERIEKGLDVKITIDNDSCFYDDNSILNLSIILKNEKKWPFFVFKYMIASTHPYDSEQFLVCIKHKNKKYHYVSPFIDKRPIKGKYMIYKKRTFKVNYEINFKKLIEINKANFLFNVQKIKSEYYRNIDNKDYGKYEIQVKYYNPRIDTIYSNVIDVMYFNPKKQ